MTKLSCSVPKESRRSKLFSDFMESGVPEGITTHFPSTLDFHYLSTCNHDSLLWLREELPCCSQKQIKAKPSKLGQTSVPKESRQTGYFFAFPPSLSASVDRHFLSLQQVRGKQQALLQGGDMARFTGGWVKIWRKAILGDIGSNYIRSGLFQALVGMANVQESVVSWRGKPRRLERGEIITSFSELASLGEVDRTTVARHLAYLELRGTLSVEKSNRGICIKLHNFDKYQRHDAEGPHQASTQAPQQARIGATHIEELKNLRREEGVSTDAKKNIKNFEARFKEPEWISFFKEIGMELELQPRISQIIDRFKTLENFKEWLESATRGKFQEIESIQDRKRWLCAAIKNESGAA